MAEWTYIVEALTDGDYGFPLDRIVEIGICRVDIDTKDVESMYCSRIRLEEGSFCTYPGRLSSAWHPMVSNRRRRQRSYWDVRSNQH